MKVNVHKEVMRPSKNKIPEILQAQFSWRKTGLYNGDSEIVVADNQEAAWWNRPLESDTLCKLEPDGIYSFNLPFIGGRDLYKTGYNILLNKNSVPVAGLLKVNPDWTVKDFQVLNTLASTAVYNTLIKLGVNKERLSIKNNDMLFDGKKFMGTEEKLSGMWKSINIVITMQYAPEKEIFDRLTGKYAQHRGITGIIEETNLFTKKQFIDALINELQNILSKLK